MTSIADTSSNDPDWAALVPELGCRDLTASLSFYVDLLGFKVLYDRPEDGFAYLQLGRAQLMLETLGGGWTNGPLDPPLGRGLNLQIEVEAVRPLSDRLRAAGWPLFREVAVARYRQGDRIHVQAEFLVQDPDGYLLRFVEMMGLEAAP